MKKEFWGGGFAAIIAFFGAWAVGQTTDAKALQLLDGMLPSIRFLCSSVMTATSSILALILSLISFTIKSDRQLRSEHYGRVRNIAKLTCAGFIGAVILLLIICVPINEAPENLYPVLNALYYFVLVYAALLGGLLVTIVLQLYQAASNIIILADPNGEAENLLVKDNPEKEE